MDIFEKKKKAEKILEKLKDLFPAPKTALNHKDVFQLLIATILSAQTTDKLVNKISVPLFEHYKTVEDFVNTTFEELDPYIKSTNFHINKAKNIIATAKIIKEKFGGSVPDTMEDLVTLPGVARKTANVVLGVWFHKNEGVVVDTHVRRISQLLGLTTHEDPVKIEKDLMEILPKEDWIRFSLSLILYGRQYCPARPHDHANCPLSNILSK